MQAETMPFALLNTSDVHHPGCCMCLSCRIDVLDDMPVGSPWLSLPFPHKLTLGPCRDTHGVGDDPLVSQQIADTVLQVLDSLLANLLAKVLSPGNCKQDKRYPTNAVYDMNP